MIHLIKKEKGYIWKPKEPSTIAFAYFDVEAMNWIVHFRPHYDPVISIEDNEVLNSYYFKIKKLKEYDYKTLTDSFINHLFETKGWMQTVDILLNMGLSKEDLATLFGFDIEQLNMHFSCGEDD